MIISAGLIGAEAVRAVQVGSPFDYEQQMKLFIAGKMPIRVSRNFGMPWRSRFATLSISAMVARLFCSPTSG